MKLRTWVVVWAAGCFVPYFAQSQSWISDSSSISKTNLHGLAAYRTNNTDYFIAVGDFGTIAAKSAYGRSWQPLQSSSTSPALYGVTKSDSLFVVVGKNGAIFTSKDGSTWTGRNSGTTNHLLSVAWNAGLFIATGSNGTILTSPDGIIWTVRASLQGRNFNAVTAVYLGTNRFAVAGDSGMILTSTDGIRWNPQNTGTMKNLYGITSSRISPMAMGLDSALYAVGDSGTMIKSMDAKNWSLVNRVTLKNLRAVAIGYVLAVAKRTAKSAAGSNNSVIIAVGDEGVTVLLSQLLLLSANPKILDAKTKNNFAAVVSGIQSSNDFFAVGDSSTFRSIYFLYGNKAKDINQHFETGFKPAVSTNSIQYALDRPGDVSIDLCNLRGIFLKSLVKATQQPGSYAIPVPRDIAPGSYIVQFTTGSRSLNKKTQVLKISFQGH